MRSNSLAADNALTIANTIYVYIAYVRVLPLLRIAVAMNQARVTGYIRNVDPLRNFSFSLSSLRKSRPLSCNRAERYVYSRENSVCY